MNNIIRLLFAKEGRAVYISHLDLMHTLQRSFSRAGYRIRYSEGFNPHPQISIALPLSLGVSSLCEIADIRLEEPAEENLMGERLNHFLPEGIRTISVYVPERKPSEIKWIDIKGRIIADGDPETNMTLLSELFSSDYVPVLKKSKHKEEVINIKDGISSVDWYIENGEIMLKARLSAVDPTVNPGLIVNAAGENIKAMNITGAFFERVEIFDQDFKIFR